MCVYSWQQVSRIMQIFTSRGKKIQAVKIWVCETEHPLQAFHALKVSLWIFRVICVDGLVRIYAFLV